MDLPLSKIRGIGEARREALLAAGIASVRDLLNCLPAGYRDLSDVRPVSSFAEGDEAAVRARVVGGVGLRKAGALTIVTAKLGDESGEIQAVWYNQPWLKTQLTPGRELLLYGRAERWSGKLQLSSPSFESGEGLQPVYRAIPGIPRKNFAKIVEDALRLMEGQWPDELPPSIRREYGLCERNYAMLNAHRPISRDALIAARRRLAFEELLVYQVALAKIRGGRGTGIAIGVNVQWLGEFWGSLPFAPTAAQLRVANEIAGDMRAAFPMVRMVQGDVGSGKTAIAFAAIYLTARAGWQSALMAPTEVLATQHFETAKRVLEPLGVTCGLLTGTLTAKARREAHEAIRTGEWQAAIGTHALITESVEYQRLALAITDEQHRFGVRQRALLSGKGESPNVLVMSATPIPRSLSLILYGDLDLSVVDELPPGRVPIQTRLVPENKRASMYAFIRGQVAQGRQAYVVCPLVEESEAVDASAAGEVYERLRNDAFPDLRVALAHGRMKAAEKDKALSAFYAGEIDVLVSTTVIEVGVNAPNASVMVVENAERFGLAQLHQLRGRVGRGDAQSWCFLMAEGSERLRLLTRTSDGFLIAQKDLESRGPGDLMGYRQSGTALPGIGEMMSDLTILTETHNAARALMKSPDTEDARAIFALAEEMRARKFADVGVN